ncbi:MAG: hypothetical protein ACOC44_08900 [Promethearchaeia archaeon]
MLSTKQRVHIVLILLISSAICGSMVVIARILDIDAQDPLFFNRELFSEYRYDNGKEIREIRFEVDKVYKNSAIVKYLIDGEEKEKFTMSYDGYYIDNGNKTDYQSIFWIHITKKGELFSERLTQKGDKFKIIDPIGLLGNKNETYSLKITGNTNYWPQEPAIDGAQASFSFDILSEGGLTSGLVFKMTFTKNTMGTLKIIDTNYDISRNRYSGWGWTLGFAIALPLISYFLILKRGKLKVKNKDKRLEMTILILLGEIAFIVDIWVDVWLYARLGSFGANLLLHLGCTVFFAAVCLWKKYGLKWVIPAILELLFLLAMSSADSSYVPYMTAFMGLYISWIFMVIGSGYKLQESRSKKAKLANNII